MKNVTKRLLASVLAAGTLLTVTPVFAEVGGEITKSVASETDNNEAIKAEYAEELALLSGLGILSDTNIKMNNSITRGEFLTLVMKMIKMDDLDTASEETVFYDVLPGSDYYDVVMSANQLGLVNGDDQGCFNPDKAIDSAAAVKILVCALDFGFVGEAKGGYPMGYISVARDLEIIDNVSVYGTLMWKDAIDMIDSALNSYAAVKSYEADGKITAVTGEETVLKKNYDVVRYKGIVEETNLTLRMQGKEEENTVLQIGGELYNKVGISTSEGDDLLGKAVAYYINEETDEIICITEDTKYNKTTIIDPEDIESANTSSIRYWDENDKEKRISISDDAVFYYNGVMTDSEDISGNDLKPENGSITLIDNDNGGGYDYVIIKDYHVMVLSRTASDRLISMYNDGENGKPFEVNLNDTDVIFYKDGYEATKYHIGEWDVLNIMMSKDKKAAIVDVSNGEFAGTFEGMKTDKDGKITFTVSGKTMEAADCFVEAYTRGDFTATNPKKGSVYFFALDGEGRIVGIKKTTMTKLNYGVLVGAKKESKLSDDEYLVKIYGMNAEWINTKLAKNAKVNGSKNNDLMAAAEAIGDRNGKGIVQLVQYRLNTDMEVAEINFATDSRASGFDRDEFSLDDASVHGKSWEQNSATAQIWNATKADNPNRRMHFVDQSGTAPMFFVPYNLEDEEFVFQMAYGNVGRFGTDIDMEIYDVLRYSDEHDIDKIGALVVYGNERGTVYSLSSINSTGLSNSGYWLVQDVYETIDEKGDIRTGIDLTAIGDGTDFTTYFADTVYNADVQGTYGYGNLKPEDLKNGDVIKITYDSPYSERPLLNLFAVYMRKADYSDYSKEYVKYYYANMDGDIHEYWNQKSAWPSGQVLGDVVYVDDYTLIAHSKDNDGNDLYFNLNGGSNTWEYSISRDEFARSTYSVIGKGDRIAFEGNLNGYAPSWIIRVVE